jgi:hypothetical protein
MTTHCFGVWASIELGGRRDGQACPGATEPFYPQNTLVIKAPADHPLEGLR